MWVLCVSVWDEVLDGPALFYHQIWMNLYYIITKFLQIFIIMIKFTRVIKCCELYQNSRRDVSTLKDENCYSFEQKIISPSYFIYVFKTIMSIINCYNRKSEFLIFNWHIYAYKEALWFFSLMFVSPG